MWAKRPAILWQSLRRYIQGMPVFVFRSEKNRNQFAFTSDNAGESLPANLGPWYRTSGAAMSSAVGLPDSVQTAIRLRGHVLIRIDPGAHRPEPLFPERIAA
jgi:hypothetical protein